MLADVKWQTTDTAERDGFREFIGSIFRKRNDILVQIKDTEWALHEHLQIHVLECFPTPRGTTSHLSAIARLERELALRARCIHESSQRPSTASSNRTRPSLHVRLVYALRQVLLARPRYANGEFLFSLLQVRSYFAK